jgi:hypothetical protein
MSVKETIFISHKSPNDNYFGAWLASKLKLLGYDVWIEIDELKSGDAFWPEIEAIIRNKSIKLLTIVSKSYLQNINDPISGIFKELSTADRVKDVKKLKVPIKIDDVSEDDFPAQLMGLNSIDFFSNWQNGLEKLLESFEKEKIPKQELNNPLPFWLDAFKLRDSHTYDAEKIYTNWFPYELPDTLYIHKPSIQSKLHLADIIYPYIEYSDRHICFFPKTDYPEAINVSSSTELKIAEVLDQSLVPIDDFIALSEPRKKIIELVNKAFSDFLFQSGLKKYDQSKGLVFYYPNREEHRKRISLKIVGKTNVAVTGKTKENRWSFAISSFAILHPIPSIRINSHIIFESQNSEVLDTDAQFQLRRKFGFDWYNRDWLDTLLGMMLKISGNSDDCKIRIPVSQKARLEVNAIPISVETDFGYREPEKEQKEND